MNTVKKVMLLMVCMQFIVRPSPDVFSQVKQKKPQAVNVITIGKNQKYTSLEKAVSDIAEGGTIKIFQGRYFVSSSIFIKKGGLKIIGTGRAEIIVKGYKNTLGSNDDSQPFCFIGAAENIKNIVFENLIFRYEKSPNRQKTSGDNLFYVRNVTGFTVKNCTITGFKEAFNFCYMDNVAIINNTLSNEANFSIAFSDKIKIIGNRINKPVTENDFKDMGLTNLIIRNNLLKKPLAPGD